jgi:hypothetical protein
MMVRQQLTQHMRDKKFITTKITNDIIMVQLEVEQAPRFSVDKQKKIIKYGSKNDYPEYLIYLYQNNPIHQAIVDTKAKYISGTYVEADENPAANEWLKKANPFETWHEVLTKLALDKVNFNGFAVQVRTNVLGHPIQFFHMDFGKLRVDEDFDCVHYSDDWSVPAHQLKKTMFPLWREGIVGDSVYYFKNYQPSVNRIKGAYPLPEFVGATMDIDTDIEISSWCNNYVKNGFSSTSIVTFFGGEPNKTEKANLAERLKTSHTGASNAGKFVLAFAPKDGKAAEISALQAANIYEQFQEIVKRNLQNTITGHRFSPALAGIQAEGGIGNDSGNELAITEERFIKGYVSTAQAPSLSMLNKFYKAAKGQDVSFEYEQVEQIGYNLFDPNIAKYMTNDEARERLGLPVAEIVEETEAKKTLDSLNSMSPLLATKVLEAMTPDEIRGLAALQPTTAPELDAAGNPLPAQVKQKDQNLTGLSAAENKDLQRVVRDFTKGRMTQDMALDRVKSYGVDEERAKKWLGIQMRIQMSMNEDSYFKFIQDNIIEIDETDEVLETKLMTCSKKGQKVQMATSTALTLTITELRDAMLNQMKGNPFVKPNELASQFKVPIEDIQSEIKWLSEKNLIEIGSDSFTPTGKAFNRETEVEETEVYTVYKYGLRDDVDGPLVIPTTRDFCKRMVQLTSGRNRLKLSTINSKENDMSSEYGINNAFDFRGGFYNDGTETTPFCRHVWIAETRIKRKKK